MKGFDPEADSYGRLLRDLPVAEGVAHPDVLVYTPMAVGMARMLHPHRIAYDVMDDLASFAEAPAGMRDRQAELLDLAHVVFAGGRSLHRSVVARRPDCHLFASGVDVAPYAGARTLRRTEPGKRPVAGYVGVLDERLDLDMVAGRARAARLDHPHGGTGRQDRPGVAAGRGEHRVSRHGGVPRVAGRHGGLRRGVIQLDQSWDAIAADMGALFEIASPGSAAWPRESAHRDAALAVMAGLTDAGLGPARLDGPLVATLADAAVCSATPFLEAPLRARLTAVKRLHPSAGDEHGVCPACGDEAPCATALAWV